MAKYVGFRQGKVHESHVISEYYCGGCGWPVTDHDSFCPECGGAFRKCDADDESIRRLEAENKKLREQASEGERVGRMLLEYRDDPPVKTAGPIEGAWYESGDILAIIMEKDEFTTGELLTRLAYLMGAREER
jgi:hypothetical protein